nr:hypothetical protein [Tanacetum cinerariifolium]
MHVHENIVEKVVKDPKITSLGSVTFEELHGHAEESPFEIESEIKFTKKEYPSQKANVDLVKLQSFEEADDDDFENKEELSKNDEVAVDNVLDEVNHLEFSLSQQVANKIDDSVPKMVANVFEELIPELLSDTLKNILPELLKESVKKALHKFNKRVKKLSDEIIQEVFVKENVVVDGMHMNLVPPKVVVGSNGLVIKEPESGIFVYNGNFDLVFQREEWFHLATTAQLIIVWNAIKTDYVEAR